MVERPYVVRATWDDEAKVWVAVSEDVPGLVTEAPEIETLIKKLQILVPELLEANGIIPKQDHRTVDIPFKLFAAYQGQIRAPA